MTSPGLLPLTVSVAYRDAEGTERSTASNQVSLSMDQHSKTSLDVELGTIVAEAWLAMVARRAMELNRMEDYREARSWLRKQSTDFNRYCRHLPGSGELVNQMRALCRSSVKPMQESSRKEAGPAPEGGIGPEGGCAGGMKFVSGFGVDQQR